MTNNKIKLITIALLLFALTGIKAQESPITAGQHATGSNGSVSYTIGQVFYTSKTGANGSATEGIQQPYLISVATEYEQIKTVDLKISSYPNPSVDHLMLEIEDNTLESLHYQLYNLKGKLLQDNKVTSHKSRINMNTYTPSVYILKVLNENQTIKEFKIIKN